MARQAAATIVSTPSIATPSRDDFAAMLEDSFLTQSPQEGAVINGKIVAIENDFAVVDVGLKTEGRVALKEFGLPGMPVKVNVGDEVEVYLERVENALGDAVLSRDKARREESWIRLERAFNEQHARQWRDLRPRQGRLHRRSRRRGGVPSRFAGRRPPDARCRPADEPAADLPDPENGSPPRQHRRVAPRRAGRAPRRGAHLARCLACRKSRSSKAWSRTSPITARSSISAASTACLHVTDIAWRRVSHPTEVLNVGQTVTVQIIKINHDTQRISLGMKQLQTDPWEGVAAKYPPGARFTGKVTNVTDYGAFVELEPGVEGLVHVSRNELGEEERGARPRSSRRAPKSKCRCWKSIPTSAAFRLASSRRRKIRGPVLPRAIRPARSSKARSSRSPNSACSSASTATSTAWCISPICRGTSRAMRPSPITRRARWSRPRCSTSMWRRNASASASSSSTGDPMEKAGPLKKGSVVTVTVTEVNDGGIEVELADGVKAFIRRADLSRDRADQRPERFGVGDKIDALVTSVDKSSRKIGLSIKAREISEEKEAVAQYGSSDSGASLGDILGAALRRGKKADKEEEKEEE